MEKDIENRQNYTMDNNSMQNLNLASAGDGLVGGIQAEVVSGVVGEILGGKYDEHHEEHGVADDDELKYVEEVQQSEKQQQQQQLQSLKNFGLNDDGTYESNELAEKETSNNAGHEFGNGNGDFVFGGDHQIYQHEQQHDLFNVGNGHDTNGHDNANINKHFGNLITTGFEEKLNVMESELDGFKNDDDLFSSSNVTESVEGFVPQIDVKIEPKVDQQEMLDEEEPSSLATNTTNGTSSLSENIPPQSVVAPQANAFDDFITNLEDKENSDPFTPQRPNELDLGQAHSPLNPDAKEFIPNFGSNPASPTSPFNNDVQQNELVITDIMGTQMCFGQTPSAVARHLVDDDDLLAQSPRKGKGDDMNAVCVPREVSEFEIEADKRPHELDDDDLVAQSPRKGKCDNDMDAVCVPREVSEFEKEADKRPHELEPEGIEGFPQRDDVMTPDQVIQQLPHDDFIAQNHENQKSTVSINFHPSTFMDHGPETCVDLESDSDIQPSAILSSLQDEDDVMKRSMYIASEDAIEDVLNSVQPIPTEIDSPNNSIIQESVTETAAIQLAAIEDVLNSVQPIPTEIDSPNNSIIQESVTESAAIQLAGDKELLQIEEKENVSYSASTEEIQMNLQNTLNSSNKDIPQLPIDLDNVNNIQEQEEQLQKVQEFQMEGPFGQEYIFQEQQQPPEAAKRSPYEVLGHEQLQENFQTELQNDNQFESELQRSHEQIQYQEEQQTFFDDLEHVRQPEEVNHQHHEEKLSVEHIQELDVLHDDKEQTQDPITGAHSFETTKESILDDTTNPLISKDSFSKSNAFENHEIQKEITESFSPFKVTDGFPYTSAIESHQEDNVSDVAMMDSFTADEKHLLEETREQQVFSMSALEQQMNQMMLNNTDDHLSQAEEVSATIATAAIEDISENLITPNESVAQEEQYQHHQQEQEKSQEQMFADDSFNQHEQECLQLEQEMNIEFNKQNENKIDLIHESVECPIEQQHQQELENEMVVVEKPIIEAKEETEFVKITKTEERSELLPCMVPEIAPAKILEPPMFTQNETEIAKAQEETAQKAIEEDKAEIIQKPEVEALRATEEHTLKEEVNIRTEITPDVPVEAAIVVATAAVVTTAAIAAKVAFSPSKTKSEISKKPLSKTTTKTTAAKATVGSAPAAKKPVETAKKPISLAAKPRTLAAKPATTSADKKPIGKTTATTAAHKPKTTTTSTATARTVTAPLKTTSSSKPVAARKPAAANIPLAKPRQASAPIKPTTLGLSGTNGAPKTKPVSPRAALTTQVRKVAPAITGAKSPIKTTATNGVTKTVSSTLASRAKTTTSTVSTTAGTATKTFTARPAPKFTTSSSTTTTSTVSKRLTVGGSTTTTSTTTKTSSAPLRKSSPTKSATGKTPTKPTTPAGGLKSKTITKPASPSGKPAPIRKPVNNSAVITNGEANTNKDLNGPAEKITAPADDRHQVSTENGDLQAVELEQQHDSSIPM